MIRSFLEHWPRKYWPREVWVYQAAIDLAEKVETGVFSVQVKKTLDKLLIGTYVNALKNLHVCFCCNMLRPAKITSKEWVICPYCGE